jgi:hypothetical protein
MLIFIWGTSSKYWCLRVWLNWVTHNKTAPDAWILCRPLGQTLALMPASRDKGLWLTWVKSSTSLDVNNNGTGGTSTALSLFFFNSPGPFPFTVNMKQWIQRCIWKDSTMGKHKTAESYDYPERDTNLQSQYLNSAVWKMLFYLGKLIFLSWYFALSKKERKKEHVIKGVCE